MFPLPKTMIDENVARYFVYNYEPSEKEFNSREYVEKFNEYGNLLAKPFRREQNAIYNKLQKKILGDIHWSSQTRRNFKIFVYDKRELRNKGIRSDEMELIERYKELDDKIDEIPSIVIGGSALKKFTKAIGKINPASIALKHKKSRNLMEQQGDLTRDYYLPELVSVGIPIAQSAAMLGSTALTGNPILGKSLFDASYKTLVTDKGFDPREQSKAKKLNKASQMASKAASAKMF